MENAAKLIFQTESNPFLGNVGANLFRIALDDFLYSDFYAEIKFVNISNIAPSWSDILCISGTILEDEQRGRALRLHHKQWRRGDTPLSDSIYIHVDKSAVTFFATHNGQFCGYFYQTLILTSRAAHNSAVMEKIHEGFFFENEIRPSDAFPVYYSAGNVSGKLIFRSEKQDAEKGASLFQIIPDNFPRSDFYAEIKFAALSGAASCSDILSISGEIPDDGSGGPLRIRRMRWQNGVAPLENAVFVYPGEHTVTFFGTHNGLANGYFYDVQILTSRSDFQSVAVKKLRDGYFEQSERKPAQAFSSVEFAAAEKEARENSLSAGSETASPNET